MPQSMKSELYFLSLCKIKLKNWRGWLSIAACAPLLSWGIVALGATPAAAQVGGFISSIQGQAEINGLPAYLGDHIRPVDVLQVSSGSKVGIICYERLNLEYEFTSGSYSIGYCNVSSHIGRRRRPRDFNSNLPYVISPRNTALVGVNQLTIVWNPVEEAEKYEVIVSGPEVDDWTAQVSDAEVTYDGPVLEPDVRYRIVVTADNGLSSRADSPVGFTILSSSEADRINEQVTEIEVLGLEPDAEAIGLTLLYESYRHSDPDLQSDALNQAALDILQDRIDAGTDNSRIYLMQGDLYLTLGLPLPARERYQQALDLAIEAEQLRQQADSLEGLGIVARGENELDNAIVYLEMALEIYETVGDLEKVEDLQDSINFLRSQV